MTIPIPESETRAYERIEDHYLIEKELAARLRASGSEERRSLYTALYDELFRRVPDHPQLTLKANEQSRHAEVMERLALLRPYLQSESTYLEIGPGDCALAIEVAKHAAKVYAVDVSEEISADVVLPQNVERVISDGCSIPVLPASVDVAFSDQLMEHLHPDDAVAQLKNVYEALASGGVYICITPNHWSGPHDVSRYFDDEATGFHLKEYSVGELTSMFRAVGFTSLETLIGGRGRHFKTPAGLVKFVEALLRVLPRGLGRKLARTLPLRIVLGIMLIARKPGSADILSGPDMSRN